MKADGSYSSSNVSSSVPGGTRYPKKRGRPSKKDLKEREKALKAQQKLIR